MTTVRERITFTSIYSGERYTGFVIKDRRGRMKVGRTAGRTWFGRFQNMLCGYWYGEEAMACIELAAITSGDWPIP